MLSPFAKYDQSIFGFFLNLPSNLFNKMNIRHFIGEYAKASVEIEGNIK